MQFGTQELVPYEDPEEVARKRAIAEYSQLQGMPIGSDLRSVLEQQIIHGNNRAATQAGSALATISEGHPGLTNMPMRDAMIAQLTGQAQQMDAQQAAQQEAQRLAGHQRYLEQSARTPAVMGGMVNGQQVLTPGAGHIAQFNGGMATLGLDPAQGVDPRAFLRAQIDATHRAPEYQLGMQRNEGALANQLAANQGTERVAQIGAEAHKYMADSTAAGRVAAAKGTEAADRARLSKLQYQASRAAQQTIDKGHTDYVSKIHELEQRVSGGNRMLLLQPDTQQKLKEMLSSEGLDVSVVNGVVTPLSDKHWANSAQGKRKIEAASYGSDEPAFQDAFYGAVKARTGADLSAAGLARKAEQERAALRSGSIDSRLEQADQASAPSQTATAKQALSMPPAEHAMLQEALQLMPAAKTGHPGAMARLQQLQQLHQQATSAGSAALQPAATPPPAHFAASQRRIYDENRKGGGGGDGGGEDPGLTAGASASFAQSPLAAMGRNYGQLQPRQQLAGDVESQQRTGSAPETLYYRNGPSEKNPYYMGPGSPGALIAERLQQFAAKRKGR